jgi:hypothetical protein
MFVIDRYDLHILCYSSSNYLSRSSSMFGTDSRLLANTPVTQRIASVANNRLGAVYSALYSFWSARTNAIAASGAIRGDAYSVIMFSNRPQILLENDLNTDTNGLLNIMLNQSSNEGTDFNWALEATQETMDKHWSSSRFPYCPIASENVNLLLLFTL